MRRELVIRVGLLSERFVAPRTASGEDDEEAVALLDQGKDEESVCRELSGTYAPDLVREALAECAELREAGLLFSGAMVLNPRCEQVRG